MQLTIAQRHICRHHPPQRAVLSQMCCVGERKVVVFQILLDGAEPRDAGTTWLSCDGKEFNCSWIIVTL